MMSPQKKSCPCTETTKDSLIKFHEKKSKVTFTNKKNEEIIKYEVDNCLIKDGIRCDKALRIEKELLILIELKGTDLDHAKKQLSTSFKSKSIADKLEDKRAALVVCNHVAIPKASSFILKTKQVFAKEHKAKFEVKSSPYEVCPRKLCGISTSP